MKALTIKQPYASLITSGLKEYEFRTWSTKYRGELLIHAGKGVDRQALEQFKEYGLEYPSGCIIAKVKLTDCIKVDAEFREVLRKKNPQVYLGIINAPDWEGYAFKLEDVKPIEPICVNGKLSFWEYDF